MVQIVTDQFRHWYSTSIEVSLILKEKAHPEKILEDLHGHSLQITVEAQMHSSSNQFVLKLQTQIDSAIRSLQSAHLNESIEPNMPTAENLAIWLKSKILEDDFFIKSIGIEDTPTSGVQVEF